MLGSLHILSQLVLTSGISSQERRMIIPILLMKKLRLLRVLSYMLKITSLGKCQSQNLSPA